jgi:subtilisin family serine protease
MNNLDPRLKRILRSSEDEDRLRRDLARGVIATTEAAKLGVPLAKESLFKRVLVMLRSRDVPDTLKDFDLIRIAGNIFSARVPVSRMEELAKSEDVEFAEAGRALAPVLDTSVPETRADLVRNPPGGGAGIDGAGVIVGIIDFGFDFTLADFRNPDGSTRVAFIWDQTLTAQAGENSPARFNRGVEYDEAAINAALAAPNPFTVVRHRPPASSHGTHVAGIAAGNGRSGDAQFPAGRFIGASPGATIIYVQPDSSDQDTTFTDSVNVSEAIAYIFEKADELGRPCVINMSLGQNGGSHDGESLVERAIDRLLEAPGRAFVVAGGNEHIWRGHASGALTTNNRRALRWKVGGGLPLPGGGTIPPGAGDRTPSEMEIWYSSRDQFSVRVTDPDGDATDVVNTGETFSDTLPSGDQVFIDSERFTPLNGDARIYIEISPAQNETLKTGVWEVEITAVEAREGRFDAWIERDARDRNNRFADQSFFLGTDFDPVMTLGTPATSRRGISVANYDHRTEAPNDSSGRGTTRDGRKKPEVAAPGTDILSSNARGGTADQSGNIRPVRVGMSGTSMSAPHVAGIVALMLQKNGSLTAAQARKILIASAEPPAGVTPFDPAWGFGKVDARAALDLVE